MSHAPFSQSLLTKIGEEGQDGELLLQTTTLPKKMGRLMSPEDRPATLKWKGKSAHKSYQPPLLTQSKQLTPPPENEASEMTSARLKRRAHRPKMLSLSNNRSRSPKLGVVGKSWSSGFNADMEDGDDATFPLPGKDSSPFAAKNPVAYDEEFLVDNIITSLSEHDSSPTSSDNALSHDQQAVFGLDAGGKQTVQVTVEMHDVKDHNPLCALNSNESTSSDAALLSLDPVEDELMIHTRSLPTAAHLNAKQQGPTGRTRRVSFSNEVTVAPVPPAGLNVALREANNFMYHNLDERNH